MPEAGALTAALLAGLGLLACFLRVRADAPPSVSWLTVALLAGASPLTWAILGSGVAEAAGFAGLATALLLARWLSHRWIRGAVLTTSVLLTAFMMPRATLEPTLFSPVNGFFSLTPTLVIAFIALLVTHRRQGPELISLVLAIALWPQTGVSLTPAVALAAPGLASAVEFARQRPLLAVAPLVLASIVWNYWLMVQYTAGMIPKDAPVSFGTMVRQQAEVHTREPFVYLFALPGDALAAWREGVPLSRYDRLRAEPLRDHFELRVDRSADNFLLDGWGPLGSTREGSYRTIPGVTASAAIPLRSPQSGVEIQLTASASSALKGAIEVNGHRVGDFVAGSPTATATVTVAARDVGRVFRPGYNRLTIVTSGVAPLAVYRLRVTPAL